MWRLLVVLLAGCDPLTGYTVEDRSSAEVVELPMRCLDSVARTTGGLWVCRTSEGVFTSRGDGLSTQLVGESVAVAGSAVWTWGPIYGAVLVRYEDQPSGGLGRSPDAGFDWQPPFASTRRPINALLAHEQDVVISVMGVQVVGARDAGFAVLSTTMGTFSTASAVGFAPAALLFQANDQVWASGPRLEETILCAFNFDPSRGLTSSGQCRALPPVRYGTGSGGLWVSEDGNAPIQFVRPIFGIAPGITLPRLAWSFGKEPWAISGSELLVPRVEGEKLIIDRYQGSAGNTWAGANESWVYEVGNTTHVRAR